MPHIPDVIIAGGGLAGLFNALQLNRAGLQVTVIEKKTLPLSPGVRRIYL